MAVSTIKYTAGQLLVTGNLQLNLNCPRTYCRETLFVTYERVQRRVAFTTKVHLGGLSFFNLLADPTCTTPSLHTPYSTSLPEVPSESMQGKDQPVVVWVGGFFPYHILLGLCSCYKDTFVLVGVFFTAVLSTMMSDSLSTPTSVVCTHTKACTVSYNFTTQVLPSYGINFAVPTK